MKTTINIIINIIYDSMFIFGFRQNLRLYVPG